MDRSFSFFDPPSILRHNNAPHPPNSSPSLLPHAALHHQHASQQQQQQQEQQQQQQQQRQQQQQQPHQVQPQHLQLQPMDSHNQDAAVVAAAAISPHISSQQLHHQQHPRPQQQFPSQQPHQFHMHQMQPPQAQQQQGQQQQHSSSHQQHQLSSLHIPHVSSQIGSLELPARNNGGAFPGTSALTQNSSPYTQTMLRDPPQLQSQLPLHSNNTIAQPGIGGPSSIGSNNFANAHPLQMQPLLPSQQHSHASFGSLTNLPSSMLQGNVVDDPAGNSSHFGNSQTGDALSGAYPWEPQSQNPLVSQNLGGNHSHHQSVAVLPSPLTGDTRGSNALTVNNCGSPSNFGNQGGSGQNNNFGGSMNAGIGVLGTPLNSTVVGGLVNGSHGGGNVAASLPSSGADLCRRNSLSVSDGGTRTGKTVKKTRVGISRKTAVSRGRQPGNPQPTRAPITSPVSTTTLPKWKQPTPNKTSATVPSRGPRPVRSGGKVKGRGRGRGTEPGLPSTGGIISSTSIAAASPVGSSSGPIQRTHTIAVTSAVPVQAAFQGAKRGTETAAWPLKKASLSQPRSRRRRSDNPNATTVPVHLRNPKKGRARVFRECQHCGGENHIRRSDCQRCKAPLPAGKRRRDGNPSYEGSRRNANTSAMPNSIGAAPSSRQVLKDDIAVASVISK